MTGRRRYAARRGIALPVVLIALAALSALAVTMTRRSVMVYRETRALEQSLQVQHLLDAGLQRGLFAILSPDDELLPRLRTGRAVPFEFQGRTIRIDLIIESGKVDVNAADPELLKSVIRGLLGPEAGPRVAEFVLSERQRGRWFGNVASVLPLVEQQGPSAALLHRHLTTYTGQTGISPFAAPPRTLELVPGASPVEVELLKRMRETGEYNGTVFSGDLGRFLSAERPIYTIGASLQLSASQTRRRELTIMLNVKDRSYATIFWGDVVAEPTADRRD